MILKCLIDLGAELTAIPENGSGVIHYSAGGGNKETIGFLLDHGFDVTAKNEDNVTPM